MIKYKTLGYFPEIKKVEIERESKKSVWIKSRDSSVNRAAKRSSSINYWDTIEEAKKDIIDQNKKIIERLDLEIMAAKQTIKEVEKY